MSEKLSEEKVDLEILCERWPSPIVAREEVGRFTGGAISPRYLANLDSAGLGPPGRFKLGRKNCYFTTPLIRWLQERATVPKRRPVVPEEEA